MKLKFMSVIYPSEAFDYMRASLLEHLSKGDAEIEFIKGDGSVRKMRCTKNMNVIPESSHPKGDSKKKTSEESCVVYDLEKDAWRSFRWDSLQEARLK